MGPQEHAFRRGVDVIVATPGRLLDHFRSPYAKLEGLEYLVLDEADRMLDMGFLPDISGFCGTSGAAPDPVLQRHDAGADRSLTREMLDNPVTINLARQAAPAVGITQALYPVSQDLKAALFVALLERGVMKEALVFTRTKHRADRLAEYLVRQGVKAERIHGNRSQAQRTQALAGFKSGKYRVLVATDIAARGIDVEELGHVVNFDVPVAPEDYIHRVGRTARAEATGEAFTFVAPEEEGDLRPIESASASVCRGCRCPTSTTRPARSARSRCRLRSASRRFAAQGRRAGPSQSKGRAPLGRRGRPAACAVRATGPVDPARSVTTRCTGAGRRDAATGTALIVWTCASRPARAVDRDVRRAARRTRTAGAGHARPTARQWSSGWRTTRRWLLVVLAGRGPGRRPPLARRPLR